jgi:lactose/L-arabinose transport system substrate-binding protein
MNKPKKILSFTMAALMVVSLASLAGCQTTTSSKTSSTATSTSSTAPALSGTITLGAWNVAETAMKAEALAFQVKNPGCTVNVIDADSSYQKLYAELAAGTGVPDISQTQNSDFQAFLNKYPSSWADITDMMAPEASNFCSYVLPLVSKDNKYYAVPWDLGPCALFYRKDLFQNAGIDPTSLTTWDKYIAAGQTLLSKSGGKIHMLSFQFNQGGGPANMILNEMGGHLYNDAGKVDLDTPDDIATIGIINKMISTGIAANQDWNDGLAALENNTLASVPSAVWYAGTLETSVADEFGKWGIVPLPAVIEGGNNQANAGGSVLAISSQSQNLAVAKAFLKFALMSNEGNAINLSVGGLFSSYKPSYTDPSYSAITPYFGVSLGTTFAALSPNIPAMSYGLYYTDLWNAQNTAWGSIFLNHADPAKALDAANVAAQKAIDAE